MPLGRLRKHFVALALFSSAPAFAAPSVSSFCENYEGWAVQIFSEYAQGATRGDLVSRHVVGKGFELRSWHGWTIENLAGSAERMGRERLVVTSVQEIRSAARSACAQVWAEFNAMARRSLW
jgi:hypothetical protein